MSPRVSVPLCLLCWVAGAQAATGTETRIDVAARCGLDPATSRFETTHYRSGDVTVSVAVGADGRPIAAFDAGALAANIVASGRVDRTQIPVARADSTPSATATQTTVVCTSGVRSVATTVPIGKGVPVAGLPAMDISPGACANYVQWDRDSFDSVDLESASSDGRVRQRVTFRRVAAALGGPAAPVCSVSALLVVCPDEARCSSQ